MTSLLRGKTTTKPASQAPILERFSANEAHVQLAAAQAKAEEELRQVQAKMEAAKIAPTSTPQRRHLELEELAARKEELTNEVATKKQAIETLRARLGAEAVATTLKPLLDAENRKVATALYAAWEALEHHKRAGESALVEAGLPRACWPQLDDFAPVKALLSAGTTRRSWIDKHKE